MNVWLIGYFFGLGTLPCLFLLIKLIKEVKDFLNPMNETFG